MPPHAKHTTRFRTLDPITKNHLVVRGAAAGRCLLFKYLPVCMSTTCIRTNGRTNPLKSAVQHSIPPGEKKVGVSTVTDIMARYERDRNVRDDDNNDDGKSHNKNDNDGNNSDNNIDSWLYLFSRPMHIPHSSQENSYE